MTLPPDPYQDPNHPLYKPHLYGDPYKPHVGDQPPWPGMPPQPPYQYQQYPGYSQTSNTFVPYPQKTVWKERKQTSHTFHLLMSVLTGGLWALLVWGPMAAWNAWGPKHKRTQRNY